MNFKHNEIDIELKKLEEQSQKNYEKATESINKIINDLEKQMKDRIKVFIHEKSITPDEMKLMLSSKADKSEIVDLKMFKANKVELDGFGSVNRVFHKQMMHFCIIFVEFLKNHIKSSENSFCTNQNKYLLKQSLTVFNWMNSRSPHKSNSVNINFIFIEISCLFIYRYF